jgi:uncharacterized protein YndB with AHSA1/START domain
VEVGISTGVIEEAVAIRLAQREAFGRFVDDLNDWWPAEYTWSQDVLQEIGIEPREAGRCYEIGPNGFRCDWGQVLAWNPPVALVFSWQIGPHREPVPDRRKASEVAVSFEREDDALTRVALEHRGLERHVEDAGPYRAALASEHRWPYILGRFATLEE